MKNGNDIHYKLKLQKKRWVSYFDLLGIKSLFDPKNQLSLINSLAESSAFKTKKNYLTPFLSISTAIEETKNRVEAWKNVRYIWFSDTLIIYTNDCDKKSFGAINNISKWFVYNLIDKGDGVPVRGAISCDDFYVDRKNNLFFGEALIEAYEYGEAQNWIGFLLCPSAEEQLENLKMPIINFPDYAYTDIPIEKESCSNLNNNLPALVIGKWVSVNGQNPIIEKLSQMKKRKDDKKIQDKYDRTIEFIKNPQKLTANKQGEIIKL